VGGQRYQVVTWMTTQKSPGGPAYRVVGYISPRGLVDRVETWLGDAVLATCSSNRSTRSTVMPAA
jgi:hypothetical protein